MKCVIAFSCLLAVASAGYLNNVAPVAYANYGSNAVAYNAPLVSSPHPVNIGYAGPLAHGYAAPIAHAYAAPIAHAYAAPVAVAATTSSQYHAQDELGQYSYGYANINSAKHESRAFDGTTAGGYSYVDGHGLTQSVKYHADALGFRVAATNLPVGPAAPVAHAAVGPLPVGDTVEVAAAKALHFQAHAAAKGHYLVKRSPVFVGAYGAPIRSYGYSAYASPLAYSGYSGYGYGGHLGAYYG